MTSETAQKKAKDIFSCRLTPEEWDDIDTFRDSSTTNLHQLLAKVLDVALTKREKSKTSDLDRIKVLEAEVSQLKEENDKMKSDLSNANQLVEAFSMKEEYVKKEIDLLLAENNELKFSKEAIHKELSEKIQLEMQSKTRGCLVVHVNHAKMDLLKLYLNDMIARKGYFITECNTGLIEPINTDDENVNMANFLINSFIFLSMGGYFTKTLISKSEIKKTLLKFAGK